MSKENEPWCCECYHYRGDTSIGEICDLTGESIYDCRPRNSHSCDKWEECICGPLNWEDIKTIEQIIATSDWCDFEISGKLWSKEFYEEVLKRFNAAKK